MPAAVDSACSATADVGNDVAAAAAVVRGVVPAGRGVVPAG